MARALQCDFCYQTIRKADWPESRWITLLVVRPNRGDDGGDDSDELHFCQVTHAALYLLDPKLLAPDESLRLLDLAVRDMRLLDPTGRHRSQVRELGRVLWAFVGETGGAHQELPATPPPLPDQG